MAFAGAPTRSIFARIVVTAPVISSMVSPRTRNAMRRPPICDGVAAPDIIRSKALVASSRLKVAPVATLPMSALKSSVTAAPSMSPLARRRALAASLLVVPVGGELEKILQDQMAVLRSDALGMELHAVHGKFGMRQAHHQTIVGFRGDRQLGRHAFAVHHQRVIARRLERAVDAAKHAFAFVLHLG